MSVPTPSEKLDNTRTGNAASKIFQTLGSEGIDIYLIASTEAKISTIIDKKHMKTGANLLHRYAS